MGGINDIRDAFIKAAPGVNLQKVRMHLDHITHEQVLRFDYVDDDGALRTNTKNVPMSSSTKALMDAAQLAAEEVTGEYVDTPKKSVSIPLAEKSAKGIAKLVEQSSPSLDGYELVDDGTPPPKKSLFF